MKVKYTYDAVSVAITSDTPLADLVEHGELKLDTLKKTLETLVAGVDGVRVSRYTLEVKVALFFDFEVVLASVLALFEGLFVPVQGPVTTADVADRVAAFVRVSSGQTLSAEPEPLDPETFASLFGKGPSEA